MKIIEGKKKQWVEKQRCGLESYKKEIEDENHVFDSIAREFGVFCNLNGQILDVGCGIRSTLPYGIRSDESNFIGIDPLSINNGRKFSFIRAIGENLPFKRNSFDHIIFATSLDHIVNPRIVLIEAKKMLKENGKINIWCGCFDWFERLQQGERSKAISLFFWNLDFKIRKKDNYHFSHFTTQKIISILRATGFTTIKMERILYDPSTAISVFFQAEKKEMKR